LPGVGGVITQGSHRRARFEQEAMPHARSLWRTALRLCHRQESAEDLVQETMLRAWKAFDQFRAQTNCKAWLFTILMNLWNEHHRKPWVRHESPAQEEFELDQQAIASNSDDRVFLNEVLACIDHLPEEQRCVLLLSVVEGLALREIAEILKIPMGTVMSRLGRARAALRESMRPNPGVMPSAREQKLCDAMKPKGC
jgi:RNA polymerase sigma-70 factor, ECF subfamily